MTTEPHSADVVTVPRRALLFVPAHRERFVVSAASAGADGVVLDLEDSVPSTVKEAARAALAANVERLADVPLVIVRVNSGEELSADLVSCRDAGVAEVLLPKVDGPARLERFHALCDQLGYHPDLSVLVESSRGQRHLDAILAGGSITSVALGVEDLRAEIEMYAPRRTATSMTITAALGDLVLAAHAHGAVPLGIVGSIAELSDLDLFARGAAAAYSMGMRGSYCIHPRQVPHLLRELSPSSADRTWAQAVLDADARATDVGHGAFVLDGAMVDAPLVHRARRILAVPSPTLPNIPAPYAVTPADAHLERNQS